MLISCIYVNCLFTEVWILGDSLPHWAGVRAAEQGRKSLGLNTTIGWWGIRGLTWSGFRNKYQANVLLNSPPKLIFLHLGGNDLGDHVLTTIKNNVQNEIRFLTTAFPETTFVWIDILQRLSWREEVYCARSIEKKRKRINRWGRHQVGFLPCSDIMSMDIGADTPGFFRQDGVHLSDVGLEFYMDYIKDAIFKHLK